MLELRPIDPDDDLDDLFEVALACEATVVDEPDTSRAELRQMLTSPQANLVDGARKAVDGHRVVGFVCVEVDAHTRRFYIDTYGHPDEGDQVWDALLAHVVDFGRRHAAHLDPSQADGWAISAGAYEQDTRHRDALSRAGLRSIRRFHRMEILFGDLPPAAPTLSKGVQLTATGDDEDLLRTAHAIMEGSFKGHWQHVARPFDDFMAGWRNESFDGSQWWIASVDGVPAGISLGNNHLAEVGLGYVNILGVLPEYRGRGLARTLLEQSFAQAYERGRRGVRLGVDSENDTGAPALYLAVGMRPVEVIDAWELPVD